MSGAKHVGEFFIWADERVQTLTRLWVEGQSASEIAKVFGITRNAVIGKVHRLGLPKRSRQEATMNMTRYRHGGRVGGAAAVKKARERAANPAARKLRTDKVQPVAAAIVRRSRLPALPLPLERVFDATHARPWTARAFGECAFPVAGEGADTLSCCLPADGATYCAGHFRLMHAPNQANANLKKATGARYLRRAA